MRMLILMTAFSVLPATGDMEDTVKKIQKEVVVAAPLEAVWQAWTTVDGLQTFFGPVARIELKLGGLFEIYFNPEEEPGRRGAEDLAVLDFEPLESFTFSWSAPPTWPTIREERTRVTVRFEALDGDSTRVILIHDRWGEGELKGEKWDEVFDYFDNAWNVILKRLLWRFEHGPVDWSNRDAVLEQIDATLIKDATTR